MKKKKIPRFKNSNEAAAFWDRHSMTDYLEDLKPVDDIFILSPELAQRIRERSKKRLISIRLAEWEIQKSKQVAKQRGVPYHALIRQWIDEGLKAAFQKHPRILKGAR